MEWEDELNWRWNSPEGQILWSRRSKGLQLLLSGVIQPYLIGDSETLKKVITFPLTSLRHSNWMWDLRFSRLRLWRLLSPRMRCHVLRCKFIDVSEERASVFKIHEYTKSLKVEVTSSSALATNACSYIERWIYWIPGYNRSISVLTTEFLESIIQVFTITVTEKWRILTTEFIHDLHTTPWSEEKYFETMQAKRPVHALQTTMKQPTTRHIPGSAGILFHGC
jgi:hypothetical protein